MFLERIAIFTIEVKEKLETFLNYLIRETNSQLGYLFYSLSLTILTIVLYYVWANPFTFWVKLVFSVIYILCFILCITGIYLNIQRKRVRRKSGGREVFILPENESKKFDHLNIKAISLNEVQTNQIFKAFSAQHLNGNHNSFQSLIRLNPVQKTNRLKWVDSSSKRPKQVNRQTLLEFLSQLFIGFENLENQQILEFAQHYFILKNSAGNEQTLSSKNISDWKNNQAAYLKDISSLIQKNL